ncbi:hypothetical protein ACMUMQ_15485 [Marinomonas sp. 2405UD66-6]|uniref:hypothetical protein n=1 Tax=Marinomonas sp. 2405UD66-6 TaxID=3391834 RepID=UPI0039C998D5
MGKNDLSSLKIKQEKKLPDETDISLLEKKAETKTAEVKKADKVISLRISASEYETLKQKAGMVPIGRYLKHKLRESTDVFE